MPIRAEKHLLIFFVTREGDAKAEIKEPKAMFPPRLDTRFRGYDEGQRSRLWSPR
jgi:hypothetical protein